MLTGSGRHGTSHLPTASRGGARLGLLLLGRHTVSGVIQAQGQLDETGFAFQYLNRGTRWNLGAGVQRVPSIYGYYAAGVDPAEPDVYRQQLVRLRRFDESVSGVAQYPFSAVQRVELGAAARRISQDRKIYEVLYDVDTGVGTGTSGEEVDGAGYNLQEASAAWVYDNTVFGYTGPLAGQRARVEASPVAGQLRFTGVLAWTADTRPTLARGVPVDTGRRGLLTSVGVGGRTNLFGFAVLEVDYVRALESTGGWHWVFAIQPGF